MGTNYYVKTKKCEACGHKPDGIHLGKSSAGWQFSFQYNGGQYYKNVQEMKKWLKDKEIEDEYGQAVEHKDFWNMVKVKQREKLNQYDYCKENYPGRSCDLKIDGYVFTDAVFS